MKKAKKKKILAHDDEEEDSEDFDEQSVVASIAGYSLPLGASNSNTSPEERAKIAGSAYGGATLAESKK